MMASGSCEENVETEKRQQFGNRYLTDPQNVFQHNAWDNVVWDSTQEEEAKQKTQQQLADALPEEDRDMYEEKASHFWDEFYNIHTNRFFKDRHWLFVEFPELYSTKQDLSSEKESNDPGNSNHVNSDPVTFDPEVNSVNKDVHNDIETVAEGVADINLCKQKHTADRSHKQNFPGEHAKFRILEVGCGVGNTVFPVLQTNKEKLMKIPAVNGSNRFDYICHIPVPSDPDLMVYCCDFSSSAIQIVQNHSDYNPERCHAFVCDISNPDQMMPMPEGSLDIVIMIFVLSAINPDRMQSVIDRLSRLLKPGGQFLFRDYGRYDMAQLRFKKGRCLSENFYVRGDGTRVYFFTQEELKEMFTKAGLLENQNLIDRRLQVNRGKQLKMYRVWLQCKFQKPQLSSTT